MFARLRSFARIVFRRENFERSMRDEMRFHRDAYADQLMRDGVSPAEAQRRAAVEFGSVPEAEEECRASRGARVIDELRQDFRYAGRQLVRSPAFTAGVVASLALGIGVNTAMFGILDRLLLRSPSFLIDPASVNRVYFSWNAADGKRIVHRTKEYPRFLHVREWSQSTSNVAAFAYRPISVGQGAATREQLVVASSASFFDFFDVKAVIGRFFTAAEDQLPAGERVAVLSFDYWQSQYGKSPRVLGERLKIGTVAYTVIGVAPRGFHGMADEGSPIAFVPATAFGASLRRTYATSFSWDWVNILIRRRAGVSVAAASADLAAAFTRSWETERAGNPSATSPNAVRAAATAEPIQLARGPLAGPETRVMIWVGGVALLVLLVACANVANLLLARGSRRRREMAVRRAMGGTTFRIVRQLLTEMAVLAGLATIVGLAAASLSVNALRGLFVGGAEAWTVATDTRTVGFAAALTLLAAMLAGILPAFHTGRGHVADSLRAGMREGAYRHSGGRAALLVVQTGLSVILLVGAGLFLRSVQNVHAVRLGYDADSLLFIQTKMRGIRLDATSMTALRDRLVAAAKATPGVSSVTPATTVPFVGGERRTLYVSGIDSVQQLGTFQLQFGSADYFRTLGTRVLRGRAIEATDGGGAPRVAVVSDAMAKVLWGSANPIGKCFRIADPNGQCVTVVGVAENIRTRDFASNAEFTYYLPVDQYAAQFGYPVEGVLLLVRGQRRPTAIVEVVRAALQREMPGDAYVTVQPLQSFLDPGMRSWTAGARLFGAFGALALLVAGVGVYAVITFSVAQRAQELGVRIALGATTGHILRLVVGEGLRVTLAGTAVGVLLSLSAASAIALLLFDVSPRDPAVYAEAAGLLVVVGLIASVVPAARAARVDPNLALRGEG